MKFYIVKYVDSSHGQLEAFTTKREAERRHKELSSHEGELEEREFGDPYADIETVHKISVVEFHATKENLRQAIEWGADNVPK